ncbi:MAG: PBSX family phage terminase large subunit, partial [Cyanobacteria bacterium J06633_2]
KARSPKTIKRAVHNQSNLPPFNERSPKWAKPFFKPSRYKAAFGGRGGGKSHHFAEMVVEACVNDPDLKVVCIREVQETLEHSAKALIEEKIDSLGYGSLFRIMDREIRRKGGKGVIIFKGMQKYNATNIKSLEGFSIAWVEEAQDFSATSLRLLRPTIRTEDSELWFSWNPDSESDPVDLFFRKDAPKNSIVLEVNYVDNPHLPETLKKEAEADRERDSDEYNHVWLGRYNKKSKEQVFAGKWIVSEFNPEQYWDGPYFGADFGFSSHPGALVKCWIYNDYLYIEYGRYDHHVEMNDLTQRWLNYMPECDRYNIRADSAEPKTISYLQQHGMPRIIGVRKWPNSVEEGVRFIRQYNKIVVHSRCTDVIFEMENYKHKVDKRTDDIMPDIVDAHNHCIDALRYALEPLISKQQSAWGVSESRWSR